MRFLRAVKSVVDLVKDSSKNFGDRVFVLLTFISCLMVAIALIGDIIFKESIVEIVTLIITLIVVPLLTYLGVHYNRLELTIRIIILGLVFVVLPIIFFYGGGVEGGGALWFIFAFLYAGLVLTGAWRTVMLIFIVLMTLICYVTEYYFPEVVFQHSRSLFYIDSFISKILVGVVCLVMVIFQNRLFKKENAIAKKEAERVEELNRAQNRFFSNMSHEIRTPINSILGLNELILRDQNASDDIVRDANGIAGSGKMLLSLINDILDFSKIEAGSMDIVPVDYQVGGLLSEIVNMVWLRAQEKGLKLDVSVDPKVPSVLYGDEVRIKQILVNLLNNAVKYTKDGTVGLHIESEDIADNTVLLRISVTDTGMGIKNDALPYLFDAFKRVDEEKNRHIEGTGLGLSIVKQLVDLMEGDITVNSVYGEGSTFNVVIKQGVTDPSAIGDLHIQNYGSVQRKVYETSFKAPEARVLIVDDNEMNLEVEKRLLLDTDIQIDTAKSGKEALEYTLSKKYDVILMDHLMPEMDGIRCLELIRAQTGGLNNSTSVIVLTANAGSENRELYTHSGFDGYLIKPVSGEQLESTLIHHISADKVIIRNQASQMSEELNAVHRYRKKIPFVITTSSMCDLPDQMMNNPYLPILPFVIKTEEGEFRDTFQMDADELLRYMKTGKKAISSPPEVVEYRDFFAKHLRNAHHLVYIAITTSMSEDYNRAMEASKSFDNVYIINSECISSATGLLTLIACKLAQQDITAEQMVEELETVKKRMKCSFVIDTTEFMAKKELINHRVHAVANRLDLRPCIEFDNDRSRIGGIWLGSRKHAYRKYIRKAFPVDIIPDSEAVFITYVDVPEETLLWVKEEISKLAYFERVIFQKASAAITSNCGPGSFGILYFVKGNKFYNISSILPKTASERQYDEGRKESSFINEDDTDEAEEIGSDTSDEEAAKESRWYENIEGIDGQIAIENSGSEESFLAVLKLFYEAVDGKSDELNKYYEAENWNDYTIKVHALKSSAKLIGAIPLSEEALALEMAGKKGDAKFIKDHHEDFMVHYMKYKGLLASVFVNDGDNDEVSDDRPVADSFMMASVYETIAKAAKDMDIDTIEEAMEELTGYTVPDDEKEKYEDIKQMVNNFDYDGIVKRLGE